MTLESMEKISRLLQLLAPVLFGAIVVGVPVLLYLNGRKSRADKRRMRCTVRATAAEISKDKTLREEGKMWVEYVFSVDGKEYRGCGFASDASYSLFKTIKVRYDPENPAHNATAYDWKDKGTAAAFFYGGLFLGVFLILRLVGMI